MIEFNLMKLKPHSYFFIDFFKISGHHSLKYLLLKIHILFLIQNYFTGKEFNPFNSIGLFLYPLKNNRKPWGFRKRPAARNGLSSWMRLITKQALPYEFLKKQVLTYNLNYERAKFWSHKHQGTIRPKGK